LWQLNSQPENNAFRPNWASPPGATISDILQERSLSNREFARLIGISSKASDQLLSGSTKITLDLAKRLEIVVGSTARFWLARELEYRECLRRIEMEKTWLKALPWKEMEELDWINPSDNIFAKIRNCLDFFGVADLQEWYKSYEKLIGSFTFRTSPTFASKFGSTAVWLRQGELIANSIECEDWNQDKFKNVLVGIRGLTRKKNPEIFIKELRERCASCGVAVVVLKSPKGCTHSGATRFISPRKAVLQLSFRYLSDDHFWFTFFHEAGHIFLHQKDRVFLDGATSAKNKEEEEADEFASRTLIPQDFREEFLQLNSNTLRVMKFAKKINVSPGIVVGQLQHLGKIPINHLNKLKKRFVWK
jgi:plasmid maintenance system antidote protein VapI